MNFIRIAKIENNAIVYPRSSQIRNCLQLMSHIDISRGLDFNDNPVIDNEIGYIVTYLIPFIPHINGDLLLNLIASRAKFYCHGILIDFL